MAIQVGGTTVIDNSRNLSNVGGLKTVGGTSILGSGDIATGGSTTYGDVGTYIYGARVEGRVSAGSTAAGSSIRTAVLYSYSTTSISFNTTIAQTDFVTSNAMSGTWRQMFDATIGSSSSVARTGLWVRIS
jgi:hypothetical protein